MEHRPGGSAGGCAVKKPWSGRLLVVLATILVFGRIVGHDFLNYDDDALIARNPSFNPPTWEGLVTHWREQHKGMYIPVIYTGWWLIASIGYVQTPDAAGLRLNPYLFHLTNLLLHTLNGLLVMEIVSRLLKHSPGREGSSGVAWASVVGGLVFVLHPLQVEPVAWATGLKDVLCGTMSLAAVLVYIIAAQRPGTGAWWIGYGVLLILALLSKPAAVVVPGLVLLIDSFLLRRPWSRIVPPLLLGLVFSAVCTLWARQAQPATRMSDIPLLTRPLIAGDALAFYIGKLLVPYPMTVDYGRRPAVVLATGTAYWTWIFPVLAVAGAILTRSRFVICCVLMFGTALLPVLGLTHFDFQYISTVADRYAYLAMLAPAILAGWAVHVATGQWLKWLCSGLLSVWAALSFVQAGNWKNDATLFDWASRVNPRSELSWLNLAVGLGRQKDYDGAMEALQRSLEVNPRYIEGRFALGLEWRRRGNLALALDNLRECIAMIETDQTANRLGLARAHIVIGQIEAARGRYPEAIESFDRAIHFAPDLEEAWFEKERVLKLMPAASQPS
jgi:hypothetical protein